VGSKDLLQQNSLVLNWRGCRLTNVVPYNGCKTIVVVVIVVVVVVVVVNSRHTATWLHLAVPSQEIGLGNVSEMSYFVSSGT